MSDQAKTDSIESLMTDLEHIGAFISQCDVQLGIAKAKYYSRRCRDSINKFSKLREFIREFGPKIIEENGKIEK